MYGVVVNWFGLVIFTKVLLRMRMLGREFGWDLRRSNGATYAQLVQRRTCRGMHGIETTGRVD